jgi:hypothetical protein
MNEADVTKTHAAKIDALNRLAASLIRSGAPVDAVQKFVDAVWGGFSGARLPFTAGPSNA